MKFVIALLLLGCFLTQHRVCSSLNNAKYGERSPRDILLANEIVYKKGQSTAQQKGQYKFVQTPDRFDKPRIISQVVVTDLYSNGKGGIVLLASGGPGFDFVTLNFQSKRSYGYKFNIEIYGQTGPATIF